jgi:hypothetical protein
MRPGGECTKESLSTQRWQAHRGVDYGFKKNDIPLQACLSGTEEVV